MHKVVLLEKEMKRMGFWRSLLNGFAAIAQGIHDMLGSFAPRETWRYEDHFGDDAEMIRRDWQAVGDDMRRAIADETEKQDKAPE